MKKKITDTKEATLRADAADLLPEDVGKAHYRLRAIFSSFLASAFKVIPISVDARVNQMKWADWAQILSNLANWTEEDLPIEFKENINGSRPAFSTEA